MNVTFNHGQTDTIVETRPMPLTLLTGPVRSGKTTFAQRLAQNSGPVRYLATSRRDPDDAEWEARLQHHAQERPSDWQVVETAGMTLQEQIKFFADASAHECIIVDSLGTWIACEMDAESEPSVLESRAIALEGAMLACKATVIVVGEQVGWDVVPSSATARLFRDIIGRMQQRLAAAAGHAYLIVSGYALDLRAIGHAIHSPAGFPHDT